MAERAGARPLHAKTAKLPANSQRSFLLRYDGGGEDGVKSEDLFRQSFVPEEVVFREGEAGDRAFVIEAGEIEISALRDGKEMLLARFSAGDLFGEMALVDGKLRSATARALSPTTLIVIRRDQVVQKIKTSDPLIEYFFKVLLERLRTTNMLIGSPTASQAHQDAQDNPSDSLVMARDTMISELRLYQELEQALAQEKLDLHYQAIIDINKARAAGFEALIRWQRPHGTALSPLQLIEFAEKTGLIQPIGLWVLREACATLAAMQARSRDLGESGKLFMSINLSAHQVTATGATDQILEVIEASGVDPQTIKLEVTETVLMEDPIAAVAFLNRLRAWGIEFAIDDFGTGYSSLSYLHRFPIDVLKIDRSFVNTLTQDSTSRKIVRSVATLARELGLRTVAEGIEGVEELSAIRELGCEFGQGYLFSRPVPKLDALALIGRDLG